MTVSRALANNPAVREDTRKAVQQRAMELGYVKSSAAKAMRGDRTPIVGLLLPNLVNEFYARFSNSLAQNCQDKGLQLIIHLTSDDANKERQAILKLREIQANAVVMVPTPGYLEDEARYLQDLQVIQLIRKRDLKICSAAVVVEDSAAISQAVKHLSSQGHRRIAYIGGEVSLSSGHSRLSAFVSGMHKAGLDPGPNEIITDTPSFAMGHHSAQWLIGRGKVSAIICGGFEISNGALNGCLERAIRLPEDIAFVGYGDPSYYRWINGGISTIRIPVDRLAEKTAGLLHNKLPTEVEMFKQLMLPAELVTRQSSGPSGQGD